MNQLFFEFNSCAKVRVKVKGSNAESFWQGKMYANEIQQQTFKYYKTTNNKAHFIHYFLNKLAYEKIL